MRRLGITVTKLLRSQEGTVAVEYAVMLALILMAMFGTIAMLGGEAGGMWGNIFNKLQEVGF